MGIKKELLTIFDESSLVELGAYLESRDLSLVEPKKGDGLISGYASILGRLVYFAGQDQSYLEGALGEVHATKMADAIDKALTVGAPIILFFDSSGLRVSEGLHGLEGYGKIIKSLSRASGMVPIISVVIGKAFGLASYTAQISDFLIMVDGGQMALTSKTILQSLDNKVDDSYGSYSFNNELAGSVDLAVNRESLKDALASLIAYLPDNNIEGSPYEETSDDINRLLDNYDNPREYIQAIADNGQFLELKSAYANDIITSFIRLNGSVVAAIANNGLLTGKGLNKAAEFVRFADRFNIPLLTLTNTEGFVKDYKEEKDGFAKKASQFALAFASSNVPKINLILKKAFGGSYLLMNSKHIGADLVYALEGSVITPMPEKASIMVLFKDEIAKSEDPIKAREDLAKEYGEKYANPYEAAKLGYVDDIIDYTQVRQRLISGFEMLLGKRFDSF